MTPKKTPLDILTEKLNEKTQQVLKSLEKIKIDNKLPKSLLLERLDKLRATKKALEARTKLVNGKCAEIENALMEILDREKGTMFKGEEGSSVHRATRENFKCGSDDESDDFQRWCDENDQRGLYQIKPRDKELREYLDKHPIEDDDTGLPPGIARNTHVQLRYKGPTK